MTTNTEQEILKTLLDLDAAAKAMKTASPKPSLLPLFDRLEALAKQLPPSTDPTLLHYLQKKSYEKARLWLEGREQENKRGACR